MKRWRLDSSKNCDDKPHYWNGTDLEAGTPWAFMAESTEPPCITDYPNDCDYVRLDDVEQLTAERDALRARVVELEADAAYSASAAKKSILDLTERCSALRARLAALESPPVVPAGWLVEEGGGDWFLWDTGRTRIVATAGAVGVQTHGCNVDPACLNALLYAHRTNQTPPHEDDKTS